MALFWRDEDELKGQFELNLEISSLIWKMRLVKKLTYLKYRRYQFRHIGRVQKPRIPIVGRHDLPKRRWAPTKWWFGPGDESKVQCGSQMDEGAITFMMSQRPHGFFFWVAAFVRRFWPKESAGFFRKQQVKLVGEDALWFRAGTCGMQKKGHAAGGDWEIWIG